MDNIVINKIWQENDLLELKIMCQSQFVTAYQTCYIQTQILNKTSDQISNCTKYLKSDCYFEFGKKNGNYTPAFSMEITEINTTGHVQIEVDLEVPDNNSRRHRCCFYVMSELGSLERFGENLKGLIDADIGEEVILNCC